MKSINDILRELDDNDNNVDAQETLLRDYIESIIDACKEAALEGWKYSSITDTVENISEGVDAIKEQL